MQTHIVEGDFYNLRVACDDACDEFQGAAKHVRQTGFVTSGMPDGRAGHAFQQALLKLENARKSLLQATSDLSDAAYAVQSDFDETDESLTTQFIEIETELRSSDYDAYRKATP